MKIPAEVRKIVAFVCYLDHAVKTYKPVGTGFFIRSGKTTPQHSRSYLMTAKHVVEGLKEQGVHTLWLRINRTKGVTPAYMELPVDKFFYHPTDPSIDIALIKLAIPEEADHLMLPLDMFMDEQKFAEYEIDLGEEVIITGFFSHHFGKTKNIPVVRVGNLASLDEEKVATKKYGDVRAYLVEARSIGGLSGSPAFLNLGDMRQLKGKLQTWPNSLIFLLGLVQGHFDIKIKEEPQTEAKEEAADQTDADMGVLSETSINAGIALVVPADAILEVIREYEKTDPVIFKEQG